MAPRDRGQPWGFDGDGPEGRSGAWTRGKAADKDISKGHPHELASSPALLTRQDQRQTSALFCVRFFSLTVLSLPHSSTLLRVSDPLDI